MPKFRTVRRQRPVKGGRIPASTGLIQDAENAVRAEMRQWNVSRSFVIATCVKFALNIEEQEDYHVVATKESHGSVVYPGIFKGGRK